MPYEMRSNFKYRSWDEIIIARKTLLQKFLFLCEDKRGKRMSFRDDLCTENEMRLSSLYNVKLIKWVHAVKPSKQLVSCCEKCFFNYVCHGDIRNKIWLHIWAQRKKLRLMVYSVLLCDIRKDVCDSRTYTRMVYNMRNKTLSWHPSFLHTHGIRTQTTKFSQVCSLFAYIYIIIIIIIVRVYPFGTRLLWGTSPSDTLFDVYIYIYYFVWHCSILFCKCHI